MSVPPRTYESALQSIVYFLKSIAPDSLSTFSCQNFKTYQPHIPDPETIGMCAKVLPQSLAFKKVTARRTPSNATHKSSICCSYTRQQTGAGGGQKETLLLSEVPEWGVMGRVRLAVNRAISLRHPEAHYNVFTLCNEVEELH